MRATEVVAVEAVVGVSGGVVARWFAGQKLVATTTTVVEKRQETAFQSQQWREVSLWIADQRPVQLAYSKLVHHLEGRPIQELPLRDLILLNPIRQQHLGYLEMFCCLFEEHPSLSQLPNCSSQCGNLLT